MSLILLHFPATIDVTEMAPFVYKVLIMCWSTVDISYAVNVSCVIYLWINLSFSLRDFKAALLLRKNHAHGEG